MSQPPGRPAQGGFGAPPNPQPQQGPGHPQQPGPYSRPGPCAAPRSGYGCTQPPQFPGTSTAPPGGSRNPFKGRPALIMGGTVYAVGGGNKQPTADGSRSPTSSAKASTPVAPLSPGDGDGGEDSRDLNAGRKPGESKVLWYKEAPEAPGSGADAPGMWITGRTAVKASLPPRPSCSAGPRRTPS